MNSAATGRFETQASIYWRQRVQPVAPVASRMTRQTFPEANRERVHGPALYVTLSPVAQARLDDLRRELAAQRANR